ncbi:MAG: hypothetical protein K0U37_06330 [Gammaproteobacteria bacterium]|nr:hypothetical protein [Gammaproteobacteria bacterium]
MKQILVLLIGAFGVSACSMPFEEPIHTAWSVPFATNDKTQYLESKNAPDLVVEKPLTKANMSGFYRLPPAPKNPKVDVLPPVER